MSSLLFRRCPITLKVFLCWVESLWTSLNLPLSCQHPSSYWRQIVNISECTHTVSNIVHVSWRLNHWIDTMQEHLNRYNFPAFASMFTLSFGSTCSVNKCGWYDHRLVTRWPLHISKLRPLMQVLMCDYDSYWDLTKVWDEMWQVTRCDQHRVRRNSLGGTPILREVIDCIYDAFMYIMFTLPCFIYYYGYVCSYVCQTCSSFKWNLRGAALMRNDLQACLRCASWEWRHDMIWAECRCWLDSLNVAATATHEICEVCHWIGFRPSFVWPSLVWATQHPHLSCDIIMYQRGITSTTCSWLIFHHRFKCTCTLPSINNSLFFCSFFHKGSPYHPHISWHPWSEGLAFDESQLGCLLWKGASPRDALRVQSISTWAMACIGPYSQAWSIWGMEWGTGAILEFSGFFCGKICHFSHDWWTNKGSSLFFRRGGKGFRILCIYIYTYIHICWQEKSKLTMYLEFMVHGPVWKTETLCCGEHERFLQSMYWFYNLPD